MERAHGGASFSRNTRSSSEVTQRAAQLRYQRRFLQRVTEGPPDSGRNLHFSIRSHLNRKKKKKTSCTHLNLQLALACWTRPDDFLRTQSNVQLVEDLIFLITFIKIHDPTGSSGGQDGSAYLTTLNLSNPAALLPWLLLKETLREPWCTDIKALFQLNTFW